MRRPESGEFIALSTVGKRIRALRAIIIRATADTEPPLKTNGTKIHASELSRLERIIEEYRNRLKRSS